MSEQAKTLGQVAWQQWWSGSRLGPPAPYSLDMNIWEPVAAAVIAAHEAAKWRPMSELPTSGPPVLVEYDFPPEVGRCVGQAAVAWIKHDGERFTFQCSPIKPYWQPLPAPPEVPR